MLREAVKGPFLNKIYFPRPSRAQDSLGCENVLFKEEILVGAFLREKLWIVCNGRETTFSGAWLFFPFCRSFFTQLPSESLVWMVPPFFHHPQGMSSLSWVLQIPF